MEVVKTSCIFVELFLSSVSLNLSMFCILARLCRQLLIVSKGAMIRNRYNQVPHLTNDTNGKVANSQIDTTNESQEASIFKYIK